MEPDYYDRNYEGVLEDAEAFVDSLLGEDGWDADPEG